MRAALIGMVAALAALTLLAACEQTPDPVEPSLVPTASPMPTPIPPTATPTPTPAPPPTSIPPTPTPSPVPTPTPTATPSPTATSTPPPKPTTTPKPPPLGPEIEAAAVTGWCEFYLEVADSSEERAIGLMHRKSLGRDRGMLFVFEEEQVLGFWMKGTLIPLDIIFIDSELNVVDVQTMRPEHEIAPDPLPIYTSAGPARYAIEINEGIAAECGVAPGNTVELRPIIPPDGLEPPTITLK